MSKVYLVMLYSQLFREKHIYILKSVFQRSTEQTWGGSTQYLSTFMKYSYLYSQNHGPCTYTCTHTHCTYILQEHQEYI